MVKYYALLFKLFVCIQVCAQNQDTINCDKTFKYYEDLLSDKLITIWETAPSLKECSNKHIELLKSEIKRIEPKSIFVSIIIDTIGIPRCFKFYQELNADMKQKFIDGLKQIRFNPAIQKGNTVESIYTLKI